MENNNKLDAIRLHSVARYQCRIEARLHKLGDSGVECGDVSEGISDDILTVAA